MKISVDQLAETCETEDYAPGRQWWEERFPDHSDVGAVLLEEPVFRVEATRMGSNIDLSGQFQGAIEAECGRCLKRYRHALQDRFHLLLEPGPEQSSLDPEGRENLERDGICLGDELESGWYQGKDLELDNFLREVIALSLPTQPVCNEECSGLCPHCGVDRNEVHCDCTEPKPESPFAVLQTLRRNETRSS